MDGSMDEMVEGINIKFNGIEGISQISMALWEVI
jgi:hypothetical protein